MLALTVVVAMLLWNWQLLLATGTGVLVMLLVYLMHDWDWQVHLSSLRQFFSGSNRELELSLAIGSGGIAAFSTYLAISIWADSNSPWIAAGAILQGFGTLATLILLVWQIINRAANRDEANLNRIVTELTHADPLKRLIAVRQLTRLMEKQRLEPSQRRTVTECFRLMLSQEQEPVVRDAVFGGLQVLEDAGLLRKDVGVPRADISLTKELDRPPVNVTIPHKQSVPTKIKN
jgi:hypothetical protein